MLDEFELINMDLLSHNSVFNVSSEGIERVLMVYLADGTANHLY
jgi:hypothetical protein